jgi:Domain of unknown function (DUF6305)
MTMIRRALCVVGVAAAFGIVSLASHAQDQAKPLEPPVLVTSSGQSLDAFTVKTLLGRAKIVNEYDQNASLQMLEGKKTLIIVAGASVKGFGAAGITAETELARTRALLERAKSKSITIVGVHIGGAERRGGASEQFVQAVAAVADRLVVAKEGDADGYFAIVAKERGIPMTLIERPAEVGTALAQKFASDQKATN